MANTPESAPIDPRQRNRARFGLIALALLFSLPMSMAVVLYVKPQWMAFIWSPGESVNHGQLIDPARPLDDFAAVDAAGEQVGLSDLEGKWTLLTFVDSGCGESCRTNLYNIRQVRLAQGRHRGRVQTVAVLLGEGSLPAGLGDEHPVLRIFRFRGDAARQFSSQFETEFGYPSASGGRVYIVDPLGNLMMSFAGDMDPDLMREDLKRLLKVSQIG